MVDRVFYDLVLMVLSAPILNNSSTKRTTIRRSKQLAADDFGSSTGSTDGGGIQGTYRYGLNIAQCPNGAEPERSEPGGQVKLCNLDDECQRSYKCLNIMGLSHFGRQIRFCCPTKISICTARPRKSIEVMKLEKCKKPWKTAYYFDLDRLTCKKGRIPECEEYGNNHFPTELECRTKCETTACELGESILLHDDNFDQPYFCEDNEDCPIGYNCREDKIFNRNVCCGFLNFEPCPFGYHSFTVPFTGHAKLCAPSMTRDECPTDFLCSQNSMNLQHYCCTANHGICPSGHQPYIHPLTSGTIKCNLRNFESVTACPYGFACLNTVIGSNWGFCCSQAAVAGCPKGTEPQLNPLTNEAQRCETDQPFSCLNGYTCEPIDQIPGIGSGPLRPSAGFCCSDSVDTQEMQIQPRRNSKHLRSTTPATALTVEPLVESTFGYELTEEDEITTVVNGYLEASFSSSELLHSTTVETILNSVEKQGSTEEDLKAETSTKPSSPRQQYKIAGSSELLRRAHPNHSNLKPDVSQNGRHISKKTKTRPEKARKGEKMSSTELVGSKSDDEEELDVSSASDKGELEKFTEELSRFIALKRIAMKKAKNKCRKHQGKRPASELTSQSNRSLVRQMPAKVRSRNRIAQNKKLRCPPTFTPMFYPGTKHQLQCTIAAEDKRFGGDQELQHQQHGTHTEDDCPKPSVCLRAKSDQLSRSLCCVPAVVDLPIGEIGGGDGEQPQDYKENGVELIGSHSFESEDEGPQASKRRDGDIDFIDGNLEARTIVDEGGRAWKRMTGLYSRNNRNLAKRRKKTFKTSSENEKTAAAKNK